MESHIYLFNQTNCVKGIRVVMLIENKLLNANRKHTAINCTNQYNEIHMQMYQLKRKNRFDNFRWKQ